MTFSKCLKTFLILQEMSLLLFRKVFCYVSLFRRPAAIRGLVDTMTFEVTTHRFGFRKHLCSHGNNVKTSCVHMETAETVKKNLYINAKILHFNSKHKKAQASNLSAYVFFS